MDGQMTFEFAQRPTIKGFPELRWTGKRPYRSTQYFPAQLRERYGEEKNGWINKIFWGDNLQVMSHMLKEYRGKIDLIYIDPPFASDADYKRKIKVKGQSVVTDSMSFEEKQYGDIWNNDEYLQFMYERLLIMRELLSDNGTIFVHCDWRVCSYMRLLMDEVFGKENFLNEIIWNYSGGRIGHNFFGRKHDNIYWYAKIYGTDDAWDDASLMDNQRFKKLCRLPQLGVYVDEAHHLFGADLEKQIRKKTANKTSLRDTINMLAERTSIVACYNYTGTPYVNKQVLPEVVYAYGLRESIWNGYLKDADPIAFENVKDTEFLRMAVTTFWERYGGKTYEGLNPKLAIYASRVEEAVNEVRPALEEILADLEIPASSILVNVGETKYTKDEDIRNFNDLDVQGSQGNEKQFIILVDKGKEGWNCRSLFGVAMFRNPNSKIFVLQATMRCLRTITDDRLTATVFLSKENYDTLDDELHKNFNMDIKNMKTNTGAPKTVHKVRVLPPPRTITLKKIWHEYKLEEKVYSTPIDFKVRDIDYSKYASVMYEKDTIARDSSLKEKNIDYIRDQMKFSAFSLAGELARYLNISCILTSRILRESVDGIDAILEAVNKYNEILNDVIVPGVFHALYEVKSELHTEDKELVLLKEPKDAGYYEFSAKDELVITNQYKALTQEQIAKSFHADTYCFDSKPEKECFLQYITNSKIKEVYFTGMFTANQGDLSVQYYDPESGRIRHYYPDFLAKLEDGSYQLIEVKGDNKIDDTVVKAKAAAAQEMAVASGIEYKMYAGSEIMTTHILAYLDGMASTISYADHMQQGTLSMVAETSAPYGSDK